MFLFQNMAEHLGGLLEVKPEAIVCDLHPDYLSTSYALDSGLPVLRLQHHFAHVYGVLAENGHDAPALGLALDGTGYGTDGTIWGGEILLADLDGFRRIGSIEPFLQAGGDLSAKEGWRIAVSLIWQISESKDEAMQIIQKLGLCEEKEAKVQLAMLERKINAVSQPVQEDYLMESVRYLEFERNLLLKEKPPWHWNSQQKLMKKDLVRRK